MKQKLKPNEIETEALGANFPKLAKMEFPVKGIANEVIELNGEIAEIFTCPICLNLFRTPKLIPNCGHSLCMDCIKQLLPGETTKLTCPECRTESEVNVKDIEKMKTNFPAQRAAELLRPEDEGAKFRIGESCPHVGKFSKLSHKCPHCEVDFCNVCLVSHLERVKTETKWIGSRFTERIEIISSGAESKFNSLKSFVEDQVRKVQEQIQGETERLLASVKENSDRLMAEAERLGEEQLAKVWQLIEFNLSVKSRVCDVQESLRNLNELSPLYSSSAEFAEVYSNVREQDKKLFALEELEAVMKSSKMELKLTDENAKGGLLGSTVKSFSLSLKMDEAPKLDLSSENLRLRLAVKADNVEVVRSTYSSMSPVIRSFVTEHSSSNTPLMLAVENGSLEVVKFLVEDQHADVLYRDSGTESTVIHIAAKKGHVKLVEYLAGMNHTLITATDKEKRSPLNAAAENGHQEVVEFLVKQKNIDIEHKGGGNNARTPLHQAAANGHLKVVETLVEAGGANMMATDKDGQLPIHLAAVNGHCDIVRFFVNKRKDLTTFNNLYGNTPIHVTCINGRCDAINCLLDCDPDSINLKGQYNRMPLHDAAAQGQLEAVRLLLKRGANVYEASDSADFLPIHLAAYFGRSDVVEFLANHDPELVNAKSKRGTDQTPLAVAIQNKQFDVAKLLVSKFKAT